MSMRLDRARAESLKGEVEVGGGPSGVQLRDTNSSQRATRSGWGTSRPFESPETSPKPTPPYSEKPFRALSL